MSDVINTFKGNIIIGFFGDWRFSVSINNIITDKNRGIINFRINYNYSQKSVNNY